MRREIVVFKPAPSEDPPRIEGARLPLGSQQEVRAALTALWGDGSWQAPDQGAFDGTGFSLLAKLGILPDVDSITLEIWGDADPTGDVQRLCALRNWRAIDTQTWQTIPERSE